MDNEVNDDAMQEGLQQEETEKLEGIEDPEDEASEVKPEAEVAEGDGDDATGDDAASEFDFVIGEQPEDEEKETDDGSFDVVRQQREEIKRLKAELADRPAPETEEIKVPPMPKIEDYDYDSEAFQVAVEQHYAAKQKAATMQAEKQAEVEQQQKQWQSRLDQYENRKSTIKEHVGDRYDAAETAVQTALSEVQQGVILKAAKDPAATVLALGANNRELARMAKITDPVEFAVEFGRLEATMKQKNRKPSHKPEQRVSGSAPQATVDSTLDRLREEADRTGDRSKVVAYMRNKGRK